MPLGRHVRRGSEMRAEHLARGKCQLPKWPRSSQVHIQRRQAQGEVGTPLPEALRGQSPKVRGGPLREGDPCCAFTGRNVCALTVD